MRARARRWIWAGGLLLVLRHGTLPAFGAATSSVPVYPQAADVRRHDVQMNERTVFVTTFQTTALPEAVVQFYQARLSEQGWAAPSGRSIAMPGGQALYFFKGDEHLQINAQRQPGMRRTIVFLNQWVQRIQPHSTEPLVPSMNFPGPQSGAEPPGPEWPFLPRYPASRRDFALANPSGHLSMVSYVTGDSVEQVMAFYQRTLPKFGWRQTEAREFTVPPMNPRGPSALPSPVEIPPQLQGTLPTVTGAVVSRVMLFDGPQGTAFVHVAQMKGVPRTMIGLQYLNERVTGYRSPGEAPNAITP